jgi:ribulose-5-phosphate 4-epimerase/fuculose-1-phosphate aldolase
MICLWSLNAQAYELRGAGAVMHSHSLHAVMATMLDPQASEFKVTHLEMIKVGWQHQQHQQGSILMEVLL